MEPSCTENNSAGSARTEQGMALDASTTKHSVNSTVDASPLLTLYVSSAHIPFLDDE
jgi:hypothetical protein